MNLNEHNAPILFTPLEITMRLRPWQPTIVGLLFAALLTAGCLRPTAVPVAPGNPNRDHLVLPTAGVEQTVVIATTIKVEQDLRVPPEVTLRMERGGRLWLAPGVTLTLDGGLEAGPYPVFTGTGVVAGTPQVAAVLPEWFRDLGAVHADSATIDWGPIINRAIDWANNGCRRVILQNRSYRIATPVDLTSTPTHNRAGLALAGMTRSTEYERGTLLIGETGAHNCVIDTSDSDGIHLKNIGILRGVRTPSTIGLVQARCNGTGWAGDQFHENLYINLGSDLAANGGIGTIGVFNVAGEETRYENLQVWANLPLALSWSGTIRSTDPGLTSTRSFALPPRAGGLVPVSDGSNTAIALTGLGRLIALDGISPIVLLHVAGTIDLGHTFTQRRPSGQAGVTPGTYRYAIENWNCYQFRHFGSLEGAGSYLLNRRDLTQAEINVRMAGIGETELPLIELCNDGGDYQISQSRIVLTNYDKGRPLFRVTRLFGGAEIPFTLRDTQVTCDLPPPGDAPAALQPTCQNSTLHFGAKR